MVVVFDSVAHPLRDRVSAAQVAVREQSAPSAVEFDTSVPIKAVMEAWLLGSAGMFRATMTGNRLIRSWADVRRGPNGRISIAVQERRIGRFEQQGYQQIVRPGELMVVDLDAPYDFGWSGLGASRCVHVPFDAVAMSHAELHRAAAQLQASPLYDLMRRHIIDLDIRRDNEVPENACESLGESILELSTAFLWSATSSGIER